MVLELFCSSDSVVQESAAGPRTEMMPPTYQSSAQHTQLLLAEIPVGQLGFTFSCRFPGYFQPKLRPGSQSNLTLNAKSKC